ncbi:MAG: GAF domain-containing protein [Acidimicrobiia bacterium]|nr:GAF domain-containing protein [Acidimicrobiia bacterium]
MSDDRIEFDPASVRDLAEAVAWARARLPGELVMLALVDGSKLLPLDLPPPSDAAGSIVGAAGSPEQVDTGTDDIYSLVEAIEARFSPILADGHHVLEPDGWSEPITAYVLRDRVGLVGFAAVSGSHGEAAGADEDLASAVRLANRLDEAAHQMAETIIINEVVAAASETFQLPKLLGMVARNVAQVSGFDRASILLLEGDGRLTAAASQFADGHHDYKLWATFDDIVVPVPAFISALDSLEPSVFERAEDATELLPEGWIEPLDLKSVVVLPLIDRDRAIGVLVLDSLHRRRITPLRLAGAVRVAALGAQAIGLVRMVESERASKHRAQVVLGAVAQATGQLNTMGVLGVLADSIRETLDDQSTVAFVLDDGRPGRLAVRGSGDGVFSLIEALEEGAGFGGSGSAFAVTDATAIELNSGSSQVPEIAVLGIGRVALIPIRRSGRDVGWAVSYDSDGRPHDEARIRLASIVASQSAMAIETAQIIETERAAVARLTENDRLKNVFVATVSHELRTPLTAILGFAEILSEMIDDGDMKDHIEDIRRESAVLESLIGNLLDTSRLDGGMLSLEVRSVLIEPVIAEAVELIRYNNQDRQIRFEVEGQPGIVNVDPERIRQVVLNLVDNALKYSPLDEPVDVTLRHDADGVTIHIDDAGAGIPLGERASVFQRFYRLDAHEELAGTGIGLYLVRALVEAHGGAISIDDSPSGGARFTVRIGLPQAPAVTGADTTTG